MGWEQILLAVSFFVTGLVTAALVLRRLPGAGGGAGTGPGTGFSGVTPSPFVPLAPPMPAPSPPAPIPPPDPLVAVPTPPPGPPDGLVPPLALGRLHRFELIRPDRLPTFADVGGLDDLKAQMVDTVGLLVRHPAEARRYRITWNGLLLHGPPGVGKSLFARAIAGELGLNLVPISTSDLAGGRAGAARVEAAFTFAAAHLPCMLLFDEFDAVAATREGAADPRDETLTQLLQSLERYHPEPRLVVAATTNDIDAIDPAVTRPGRFDRLIRLDLPDANGRCAILESALAGRPVRPDIDLHALAERTRGMTPAAIAQAVEAAALAACRQAAGTGRIVRIASRHLTRAIDDRGGEDRPTVEYWSWARLVLPPHTLAELREVQSVLEHPESAAELGVDPPSGLLLTGPPGTGKTTIAKVLAAEAQCSFYPVSAADVTSRWVGDSERRIAHLFQRARANAPSIVFIDEIDAIASARGELSAYDRQLDQLLEEIDGMSSRPGVLVVGATNRPQALDPALIRGGRLARRLEIPLPDRDARLAILGQLTARMPMAGVDLGDLAAETEGFSGGDLKSLCQQAALEAMVRQHQEGGLGEEPAVCVTGDDFSAALAAHDHDPVPQQEQDVARRHRPRSGL